MSTIILEAEAMKKTAGYAMMIICAVLSAINYKIFVFPNSFAPAGVDGICTMIQYLANTRWDISRCL